MKSKNIGHNKIKNTGILFEMLIRQITLDAIEGRTASSALSVLKKYFNTSTQLGKELQLYHVLANTNQLSEAKAIHLLELALSKRKKLDERLLAKEKYNLIKEIKDSYDLDKFMSCRIVNYKLLASIYKTFLAEVKEPDFSTLDEVTKSRFTLLEHLGSVKTRARVENQIFESFKNQTEDLRLLTYKVLIQRFNEKYSNLNDKQKVLLREYINSVSNTHTLQSYIKSEIPSLRQELINSSKKQSDKITSIKLLEVANQLDKIAQDKIIKDTDISAMIIAYEIAKEINNE